MNQSKQSKQAESKNEYGTMTAKMDANNDYASKSSGTNTTASTSASSSMTSGTSANMSELSKLAKQSQTGSTTTATSSKSALANQTLTAKYDANGDYSAE
ncbi:hypothetical protein [Sporomusa acidovorans]|uniref:Uncharacterized protein n=1 Tax=Sporomusa acidovorans (strain ATCC 49682 / DSM 3132 / Mol) TaxID=1123286 RepID=A0ABZ3J105_SPOA4|nr:hypothetical protein [Sporomusa acidovorans]OZC15046.1 hypothetical protein SPACI_51610 [Sporomusa acidovorans DSM 3132]SDE84602.1 hypothetical protein SAMN04488499_102380 [Sporomusa acidovorans]